MTTTPATETAGMNDAERAAATAIAEAFGHTRETLDERPATRDKILAAGKQAVAALVALHAKNTRDDIAEALFDLAHDGCDDMCVGGGQPWYDGPAARLADPHGVLAEIAVVRQMRDDDGVSDHPDGTGQWVHEQTSAVLARESAVKAAAAGELTWAHLLRERVYAALAAQDPVVLRAALVDVADIVVAWVEAIDRREAGR